MNEIQAEELNEIEGEIYKLKNKLKIHLNNNDNKKKVETNWRC